MTIENAKIIGTSITMADHGCLTFFLTLSSGNWGICYGGYRLGSGYLGAKEFKAENGFGLEAMMHIMDTVGVDTWEDLKDKYLRVKIDNKSGSIYAIGNLIEDRWFSLEEFAEIKNKKLL